MLRATEGGSGHAHCAGASGLQRGKGISGNRRYVCQSGKEGGQKGHGLGPPHRHVWVVAALEQALAAARTLKMDEHAAVLQQHFDIATANQKQVDVTIKHFRCKLQYDKTKANLIVGPTAEGNQLVHAFMEVILRMDGKRKMLEGTAPQSGLEREAQRLLDLHGAR